MIADCEVCVMCMKMKFFDRGGTSDLILSMTYDPRIFTVCREHQEN